jgi:hypothetical protein
MTDNEAVSILRKAVARAVAWHRMSATEYFQRWPTLPMLGDERALVLSLLDTLEETETNDRDP